MASWSDVPHLTEEAKASLFASIPAYQRDARTRGIPVLGSGAIFQISADDYVVPDIPVPPHWPRAYGFDIGWRKSAVAFVALNRDSDTLYVTGEHYRGEAEPVIHAEAIKARGKWLRGAIDPAARGRNQIDGRNLLDMYKQLGLELTEADNAVEAGIYQVMNRLTSGRLKVFKSCTNLQQEMRLYRRDEKGRVVKDNDHLVDALRYAVMELQRIVRTEPAKKDEDEEPRRRRASGYYNGSSTGWMS